ncbi:chromatin assembly factor 1 subunit A-A isoform X2 [Ixodes scapularis]|uniref:chromatin assembly factor 1 subunit A-A isoform X2 n=1 Tax=Ixodes scapularis TaxID=6945 RepID=UPI001A9EE0C2|nr:chromatin assembly factor 1 subunit A-A isoform X2 [Ixodes scapularis]
MAAASATPAAPTPSRRRFTVAEDIILLQAVVARNPLRNADHWNDVMDSLCAASQRDFSLRGTRERCDLLLGYYHQNDDAILRKCSTEEQYRKKVQLLKAVAALAQECGYRPKVLPRKAPPARRGSVRGFLPSAAPPPIPAGGTTTSASDLRDVATVNASAAGTLESSVDLESAKSTLFASKRSYSPTAILSPTGLLMQVYVEETEDAPASPVSGSEGQPSGGREKSPEPNAGPSSEKTAEEINLQWTPPSQRKRRQDRSGIEYIRKRFLWDVEMRQKELALEARRLALDARRLELEEKRFKFEERRLADEIQLRAQERREREEEKHTRLEQMRLLLEQQEINIQLLIKETNK